MELLITYGPLVVLVLTVLALVGAITVNTEVDRIIRDWEEGND